MYNTSKSLFEDAKKVIPGGVDSPVRAFSSVGGTPPFMKSGSGAYITDEDNNKYLDFVQSWGPLIFGHCDKDIEDSVISAVKNGLSFGAPTKTETLLADEIVEMFDNIDKIRFVSSGTEAVMSAIRLARGVTNRNDIIKFTGCYHGHSDSLLVQAGSGAATFGTPSSPGVPADFTKHTILCQYNNIEQLRDCFDESSEIACVIIEPIAGNMGLVPASDDFLVELRKLCDDYGVLLIFDEVMSGFRASLKGASGLIKERLNIEADIVTFGKVIGAGMPVGAFCASSKIMNQLSPDGPIYQAGTLSGNPVAMSAGLTSLRKLKGDKTIYNRLEAKAKKLTDGLKNEANKYNIDLEVGYIGSMFGFFFNSSMPTSIEEVNSCDFKRFASFHQMMLARGFYFACSQYETGFISDAMNDDDIEATIKNAGEVFSQL